MKSNARRYDSDRKGRLAERVAAKLHSGPGVTVQTRVKLSSTRGGVRRHEIDILLTVLAAGYEIQIPIECKNQRMPVGKSAVESFLTKLRTVGLPERLGVFISTSEFTSGARDTAEHHGIRLYLLAGLDEQGVAEVAYRVAYSGVYLVLEVESCTATDSQGHSRTARPFFARAQPDGWFTLLHIIQNLWLLHGGCLPLGRHRMQLKAPPGVYQREFIDGGRRIYVSHAEATVRTSAIVLDYRGQATNPALIDAFTKKIHRTEMRLEFERETSLIRRFESEDKLSGYLDGLPAHIRLTLGRIQLPRILWKGAFWPWSARVKEKMFELTDDGNSPEKLVGLGFDDLESWPASLFESGATSEAIGLPPGSCDWEVDVNPAPD